MKVYVVYRDTNKSAGLIGAYKNKEAAAAVVKKEYDHTVEICEFDNLVEGWNTDLPSDCGASIHFSPYDYWIWTIEECELVE